MAVMAHLVVVAPRREVEGLLLILVSSAAVVDSEMVQVQAVPAYLVASK
jgi:hypothetical protein